jgi:hypothetical protein
MIWFWISGIVFIAWFISWLTGAANAVLWGLTLAWVVTLIIGAMIHKYPPRPTHRPQTPPREQKRAA